MSTRREFIAGAAAGVVSAASVRAGTVDEKSSARPPKKAAEGPRIRSHLKRDEVIEFDEKKIDRIFAGLDQGRLPGAAVGIAIGGKPVYRKGFGLASMELPVVLSPTIRMRIGSTTKHFTCLAYLLLCEQGKAGIDDPIGKHLPELHPVMRSVTMRQVMGNISGLRDACDIRSRLSGMEREVSAADILSLFKNVDDLNFAPGTAYAYNNGGFLLLGIVVERLAGKSLEDVFRESIFEPAGMCDTLLRRSNNDFVPNSATLHMTTLAGGFDRSYLPGALTGEGGIVSTVDDMLRWLAHMDAPVVGTAATWEAMKRPQKLVNGTSTDYSLGLKTGMYRGVQTLFHSGGVRGGNSDMLKVPAAGIDIAIMTNRQDVFGSLLTYEILDCCLPHLDPIRKAPHEPRATGVFRSRATGCVIRLAVQNGQQIALIYSLETQLEGGEDGVLRPAGLLKDSKYTIELFGDPARPSSIRFTDYGNIDELEAVEPAQTSDVASIAGGYRSAATGTEVTIFDAEGGPQLKTVGRFGSMIDGLECLAKGIWRAKERSPVPHGGILVFNEDGTGFHWTNRNTRKLPFRRCRSSTGRTSNSLISLRSEK